MIQFMLTVTILFVWFKIGYWLGDRTTLYRNDKPDAEDIAMGMLLGLILTISLSGVVFGVWTLVGWMLS